ncbi:hypothetical protein ES703_46938 [subsurface metagenome]
MGWGDYRTRVRRLSAALEGPLDAVHEVHYGQVLRAEPLARTALDALAGTVLGGYLFQVLLLDGGVLVLGVVLVE